MKPIAVFWFRRDLRLDDNAGLYAALNSGLEILPIFIFDTHILDKLPTNDARVGFIHSQISGMNAHLNPMGKKIHVLHGDPLQEIEKLTGQYNIAQLHTSRDYEPYGIARDKSVQQLLSSKNIDFVTHKDHVIFEKDEVVKADGTPYKVYTPYSNTWRKLFEQQSLKHFPSETLFSNLVDSDKTQNPSLDDIGFENNPQSIPSYRLNNELIDSYEQHRDYPAIEGTSKIGVHLRFGSISVRKAVRSALTSDNPTFLKELIWREFFMQILWHYPHTQTQSFKPQYDRIPWRNDPAEFKQWCAGNTGFPLVDAGMRELNQTGFMHNRVRMLVGSFLCKHLLIDWRWGEAYFAEKLLDYEAASNIGNWQWVAGCGVDAAPYFRIFNPTSQIKKFDKDHSYIKKWVPEYSSLSYTKPMVDHPAARQRCLEVYKSAIS